MRMGLPQVIISDNGKEFDNELDTKLKTCLGLKRRLTTPYHPQVWLGYSYNYIYMNVELYIYTCVHLRCNNILTLLGKRTS